MLDVRAGKRAYQHIMKNGLAPSDISAVFGASGAAKWLAITGLDSAIFSDWLPQSEQTIDLFGTSVGAIKLAAAVQQDPRTQIAELADAYIHQRYEEVPHPDEIQRQGEVILDKALGFNGVDCLLNHTRYRFHCGAVECGSGLASKNIQAQKSAMVKLAWQNLRGKQAMTDIKRVIFSVANDEKSCSRLRSIDGIETIYTSLDYKNLKAAIRASGSIPVYMHGVELPINELGDSTSSVLRDGGLLDYHPSPSNFSASNDGFVLYPHFYGQVVETWFDKFLPWRKVSSKNLENVILLYPSKRYIERIAMKRIPSRQDFDRYNNQDELRIKLWQEAVRVSYELGEEWLALSRAQNWDSVKEL